VQFACRINTACKLHFEHRRVIATDSLPAIPSWDFWQFVRAEFYPVLAEENSGARRVIDYLKYKDLDVVAKEVHELAMLRCHQVPMRRC